MGNRRIGAQRLNALLRRGSTETDSSYQAGAGISGAIKTKLAVGFKFTGQPSKELYVLTN